MSSNRRWLKKWSTKESDDDLNNSDNSANGNNDAKKHPKDSIDVETTLELSSNMLEDGELGLAEQAIDGLLALASNDQNSNKESSKKRWLKKWSTKESNDDLKDSDDNNNANSDKRKRPKDSNVIVAAIELGSNLFGAGELVLAEQAIDGLSAVASSDDQNSNKKSSKKGWLKKRNKKRNRKKSDDEKENGENEIDNGDDGMRSHYKDEQDRDLQEGLVNEGAIDVEVDTSGLAGATNVEVDTSGLAGATNVEVDASGLEDGAAEAMVNMLGLFFG